METARKQRKIKVYDLVSKKPVARFYYQGAHSHPVRRTVLIIEETEDRITGYEFRVGNMVRTREEALESIKTYLKDRIPKWGDYGRLRQSYKTFMKDPERTTLERSGIMTMFSEGA